MEGDNGISELLKTDIKKINQSLFLGTGGKSWKMGLNLIHVSKNEQVSDRRKGKPRQKYNSFDIIKKYIFHNILQKKFWSANVLYILFLKKDRYFYNNVR